MGFEQEVLGHASKSKEDRLLFKKAVNAVRRCGKG